jgi:hypothetical protein
MFRKHPTILQASVFMIAHSTSGVSIGTANDDAIIPAD